MKPQRDVQKKRKQTLTAADEPESKMNKTESSGSEATQGTETNSLVSVGEKDHTGLNAFLCLSWSDAIVLSFHRTSREEW